MKRLFLYLALVVAICPPSHADNRLLITQSTVSDCGPAALATLLTHYLEIPATEAEMVLLSKAKKDVGTTLLGLEKAANARDCVADSFRMTWPVLQKQLATYPTPVIVRTLSPEPHFSVLLGIEGDELYVADPAIGNLILKKDDFLKRWYIPGAQEGFVFIAAGPQEYVNHENRLRIIKGLKKQRDDLQKMRPPISSFRR